MNDEMQGNGTVPELNGGRPEAGQSGAVRNGHRPESVQFEVVEPWPGPVNGEELLDELVVELRRFVVFSKWVKRKPEPNL